MHFDAWNFGCNTIRHWIVGRQVVKGVVAPSSIVEVGYVGTWVHLILEGIVLFLIRMQVQGNSCINSGHLKGAKESTIHHHSH
jgi:hypothetical protein